MNYSDFKKRLEEMEKELLYLLERAVTYSYFGGTAFVNLEKRGDIIIKSMKELAKSFYLFFPCEEATIFLQKSQVGSFKKRYWLLHDDYSKRTLAKQKFEAWYNFCEHCLTNNFVPDEHTIQTLAPSKEEIIEFQEQLYNKGILQRKESKNSIKHTATGIHIETNIEIKTTYNFCKIPDYKTDEEIQEEERMNWF